MEMQRSSHACIYSGNNVSLISSFQTQQTTEMIREDMLLKMQ
jgi:hypothetical protein